MIAEMHSKGPKKIFPGHCDHWGRKGGGVRNWRMEFSWGKKMLTVTMLKEGGEGGAEKECGTSMGKKIRWEKMRGGNREVGESKFRHQEVLSKVRTKGGGLEGC